MTLSPSVAARRPAPTSAAPGRSTLPWVTGTVWTLVVLAAAYGVVIRVWLLTHLPLNSDEAIAGLMGRAILSGHPSTFYWGQQYGGVEPYLVAVVLKLVNGGPTGLNGTAALLSAVACVVVGLAVAGATQSRRLGALAGALAWVWPYATIWNGVRESGFRQVVLCCGLVMVACALRLHRSTVLGPARHPTDADPRAERGRHRRHRSRRWAEGLTAAGLGLAAGLGWWASPEIVYFVIPTVVLLAAAWGRLFRPGRRLAGPFRPGPVVVTVLAAVVGSLPWLYSNVRSGFASLETGSLPNTTGLDYSQRLVVFFRDMLPMQLGVRAVPGGAWAGGSVFGPLLYGLLALVVAVALARALLSAGRGRAAAPLLALALGVLAFPFIYALIPASGYWTDGRYGVLLPSLLILLLALAGPGLRAALWTGAGPASAGRLGPKLPAPTGGRPQSALARVGQRALMVGCAGLVVGGALTVATARAGGLPASPGSFFSGWGDPEAAPRQVVAGLEAHHLRDAYGSYWTAYVLDFLAPTKVAVSPSTEDVDRWPALAAQVAAAPQVAWLFFAPGQATAATDDFGGNPEAGPGGFTEARFTGWLEAQHMPYHVVHLGVLDAVVPQRKVVLPS